MLLFEKSSVNVEMTIMAVSILVCDSYILI